MRFHGTIAEQCQQELLRAQLENLQAHTRRLIFYTKLFQSDPLSELDSHRVLDALGTADPATAQRVIFEHRRASGERLVQRMMELEARRRAGQAADGTG